MGISLAVMSAISIGMAAVSTIFQNQALSAQNQAFAEEQRLNQIEVTRQQTEANVRAKQDQSDVSRRADASFASMIVAMADGGGAGGVNEIRLGADVGSIEGIDLARIEGNRRRQVEALQSNKELGTIKTKSAIKANVNKGLSNTFSFLGSAASTIAGVPSSSGLTTTGSATPRIRTDAARRILGGI